MKLTTTFAIHQHHFMPEQILTQFYAMPDTIPQK